MEKANQVTGFRVDPRDVRTLSAVAMATAEREIFGNAFPAMLAGDDVVDRETKPARCLWHPAVFARVLGAGTNQLAYRFVHRGPFG